MIIMQENGADDFFLYQWISLLNIYSALVYKIEIVNGKFKYGI